MYVLIVKQGKLLQHIILILILPKIIRKKHDGKKLTADEKHKFERAWKVASLVENFGKIAITVMSGYGVGADTAARILRNMIDEEHLFKQIYEAERQYVVTQRFLGFLILFCNFRKWCDKQVLFYLLTLL